MHEFIVPGDYIPFIDHAIVRLSFLFPSSEVTREESLIRVKYLGNEPLDFKENFKEELFNQLYRERIYQDTLPIKHWLFSEPAAKDET
jgi:hypothetical protein